MIRDFIAARWLAAAPGTIADAFYTAALRLLGETVQ